jgi:hypothetical protein
VEEIIAFPADHLEEKNGITHSGWALEEATQGVTISGVQ